MQSVILQFWEAQEAHSQARALSLPPGYHDPWLVTYPHDGSAPRLTGIKICIFCELTDSLNYPGFPITCGNDEEFFMGQGTVPGLGSVFNKACMQFTLCGSLEPVTYQGITYSLISTCCYGQLCNRDPTPSGNMTAGPTTGLVLGVLLLH
ncbi:sperm acrosome membrane-associated protein 4-like [Molossus nigricans]